MFPSPQTHPLERLQVTDGLLLTAERWRLAHEYHRQRQNVHYQSLHQPGIVCGLKVSVAPAPEQFAAQYRDDRWLMIQPGVAIDTLGNPIIVPEAIAYRLASEPPRTGQAVIYLVLSYVDPDRLHRSIEPEMVQETFRIDEKTTPPDALEVELCRVQIQAGSVSLTSTPDVFSPGVNHVDLRYRQQVRARPLGTLRINAFRPNPEPIERRWVELVASLAALYPHLGAELAPSDTPDLLTFATHQFSLTDAEIERLKHHVQTGGTLLLNADAEPQYFQLAMIRQELQQALAKVRANVSFSTEQQALETELAEVENSLSEKLEAIAQPIKSFAEQLGVAIDHSGKLDRHHPLRHQPFLFSQFPVIHTLPIEVLAWGGVVLVIGDLTSAWSLEDALPLPRETLRSCQELGVNLLHFAWKRKSLTA